MSVLWLTLIVATAGGLGGIVAALISEDKGFIRPKRVKDAKGVVFRPGFIGLILVGAAAAAISWGMYGPFVDAVAIGGPDPLPGEAKEDEYGITLGALAGAVLVGASGGKWISSQVDKVLLKQTAATVASKQANPEKATEISNSQPAEALVIAQAM